MLFLHYNFSQEPLHDREWLNEREELLLLLVRLIVWTTNPGLSINADVYAADVGHFATNAAGSLFHHLLFHLTYVW